MSARLSASRDGASKKTSVAGTAFSSASRSCRAFCRGGRKPANRKASVASPADGERRQQRRRARQADHRVAGGDRLAHQLVAGVGDQRRAGVADDGDRLARRQLGQHARPLALGVVLVIGPRRPRDGVVGEQRAAVARVLAVDHVGPGQHGERPERDVGEVADRRGDEVEARPAGAPPAARAAPARGALGRARPARGSRVLLVCRHLGPPRFAAPVMGRGLILGASRNSVHL